MSGGFLGGKVHRRTRTRISFATLTQLSFPRRTLWGVREGSARVRCGLTAGLSGRGGCGGDGGGGDGIGGGGGGGGLS